MEQQLLDILHKTRRGLLGNEQLEEFGEDWMLVTTDLVADNVATPALFLINKHSQKAIVVSAWPNIFTEQQQQQQQLQQQGPNRVFGFDPNSFFTQPRPQYLCPPLSQPLLEFASSSACGQGEVLFKATDGSVNLFHSQPEGGLLWMQDCGDGQPESRAFEELGVSFCIDEQFTISGPFGVLDIEDPVPGPQQRWWVSMLVSLALDHGIRVQSPPRFAEAEDEAQDEQSPGGRSTAASLQSEDQAPTRQTSRSSSSSWSSGDQVEVKYKGQWLKGELQDVQGETARVKCDVDQDKQGLITLAPLDRIRAAGYPEAESEQKC
jgi:hypothetical protein